MNEFIVVSKSNGGNICIATDSIQYAEDKILNKNKETHIHVKGIDTYVVVCVDNADAIYKKIYEKQ